MFGNMQDVQTTRDRSIALNTESKKNYKNSIPPTYYF